MIKKILLGSYGFNRSDETIKYISYIAKQYDSEIVAVYVRPTSYFQGIEDLPARESGYYSDWINKVSEENIAEIEKYEKLFKDKGLNFRLLIKDGIPYEEIIKTAVDENADLIAVGKGRSAGNDFTLSRTVIKLIRESNIPVLSAEGLEKKVMFENILVPTGLYNMYSKDFEFALQLSQNFKSRIYHLSVMNTAHFNLPAEVTNKMRGDIYTKMAEADIDYKNVEPRVTESVNPAKGIVEFVNENKIDLLLMLAHTGRKRRNNEFIGSVAQSVLQGVSCPVITLKP